MKPTICHLCLLIVYCIKVVSLEGFCEKYWRDGAQVLGCIGYTETIKYNFSVASITEVNIIKNNLPTVNSWLLKDFTSVRKLWLTFNDIKNVEDDSFSDFANITSINLSFNNIKDLPENLFDYNFNLLELSLKRNAIRKLKPGTFSKLMDLKTVDLSFNYIEHLPKNLFVNNANLEKIDLRENEIKDLSNEIFSDLTELNEIDLSYNCIEILAPHVFKNNFKLRIIRARGNRIKLLDYSITHLNLEVFDLFKNPLLMEEEVVKETLEALERSDVKTYLKHTSQKHGHKKEYIPTIPTYIKTALVLLLVTVAILLVAVSGLIVSFFTKMNKKTVPQYFASTDSEECLIAEDNYLKLKIPKGIAVYVKNSNTTSDLSNNSMDEISRPCESSGTKSVIV